MKANLLGANGRYEFRSRIRFVLKDDELKQRVKDLRDATDTLTKLRHLSTSLAHHKTRSEQNTVARYAVFLQRVQRHAEVLYSAISQRLVSGCHQEHETRFYLEHRAAVMQEQRDSVNFNFNLGSPAPLSLLSRELQVAVLEDEVDKCGLPSTFGRRTWTDEKHRVASPLAPKQPGAISDIRQSSESHEPLMAEVQDLCLSLDQAQQASTALKLYLSQRGVLSGCRIPRAHSRVIHLDDCTQEVVSLEQILLQNLINGRNTAMWSPIQRMILSFNIASSLLQLCSTPWMAESLSKHSIFFWRPKLRPMAREEVLHVDIGHPFIIQKFSTTLTACRIHRLDARNQLLNLGILLLEIGHERSFESLASVHGFTLSEAYGSRYDAASAWLNDSTGTLSSSYFNAAARCIECTFQTRSAIPGWEDLDFRKSVCELVIKPLWDNCFTMED